MLRIPLILCLTSAALAQWPTIGGNSQHNGRSPFLGPLTEDILWSAPTAPAWFGGPIFISGNRIITMRFNGLSDCPIVCHSLSDGTESWRASFTGSNSRALPIGFRDNQIYAINFRESQHDTLYALSPTDGSVLWRAQVQVFTGIIFSAVYTDNGDFIVPADNFRLARINHTNGDTLWTRERFLPVIGGSEHLAIFGNRVYGWQGTINTPKELTVWDVDSGDELYSRAFPGDGDQEITHIIGPDGIIYLERDGGLFYAVQDTGDSLRVLWNAQLENGPVWGNFAIAGDGHVIASDGQELVKLDHDSGTELARSNLLATQWFNPRFAIGADSLIYLSNGAANDGGLYCLNNDLEFLWSVSQPNITYSGPAFGDSGQLVIASGSAQITAYRGRGVVGNLPPSAFSLIEPADSLDWPSYLWDSDYDFRWFPSHDPNGDDVAYDLRFHFFGWDSAWHDTVFTGITDTTISPDGTEFFWNYTQSAMITYPLLWWVEAIANGDTTRSSETRTLIVWIEVAAETKPGIANRFELLSVYPNPFNSQATIRFELARESDTELLIFNTLGREVQRIPMGRIGTGIHEQEFSSRGLASGAYFAQIRTEQNVSRIVKLEMIK